MPLKQLVDLKKERMTLLQRLYRAVDSSPIRGPLAVACPNQFLVIL
jgi:hypothetical protein